MGGRLTMPDEIDETSKRTEEISERINELATKSTQVLLFLSFAMLSVATLQTVTNARTAALNNALWWWKLALLPVLMAILPMKEFRWKTLAWYKCIQRARVFLLWLAVILIVFGVLSFFKA
jgi:cytochrome bd-type quinol oxidase subunit 2